MGATASQITSLTSAYSTVYPGADHRKHQSSASMAFVRGIHRWPVNSPLKGPVTRKMFPFDDVIMFQCARRVSSECHTPALFYILLSNGYVCRLYLLHVVILLIRFLVFFLILPCNPRIRYERSFWSVMNNYTHYFFQSGHSINRTHYCISGCRRPYLSFTGQQE